MREMLIIVIMILDLYLGIVALTIYSEKRQTISADEAEIAEYSDRWEPRQFTFFKDGRGGYE